MNALVDVVARPRARATWWLAAAIVLVAANRRLAIASKGRYELRLCTTAGGSRCARRTLKVARSSIARLPGLSLAVPAGATGRVTFTVRATRGVFSALTAKRPSAGLLLGP